MHDLVALRFRGRIMLPLIAVLTSISSFSTRRKLMCTDSNQQQFKC